MHLQLGEIPTIVISSPRVAQEVLKTHDIAFTNRPELLSVKVLTYNCSDIAFAPYGNYWRQMRKLCTLELLSAKNVVSFASIREEEALNLVQYVESKSGSIINLTEKIYALTNAVICRAAFGKRRKEESVYFMSLIKELSLMVSGLDISEVFPSLKFLQVITGTKEKLLKLHKKFDKVLDMIIEEHKHKYDEEESSRKNDLVNLLLKLQESGTLDFSFTADNIKAVILDMFLAGTETSATVLDWAMVEMMRNPKVMEKAQTELRRILKGKNRVTEIDLKEVSYLKLVIKETLRLHPPLPLLLPRECREHCVINGYDIPIKTKVIVNAWAINRDAEFWENAESFSPERFINCASNSLEFIGQNFEYLPFGGGRRMCPGISFGLSNVELPLAQLIYHFNWKLPNGMKPEDVDVTETPGSSCSRKYNLCVIATSNDHRV
uniref:Cytochrome P450 hydroxylase n=2 Tax=Solanum tuberosum TaxID=4113 RepID=M1B2A2_SOLTU